MSGRAGRGGGRRRDERGGRGARKRPPRGDREREQAVVSSPTKDVHFKIIKNVEREKQEQQRQLDQEFPGMKTTKSFFFLLQQYSSSSCEKRHLSEQEWS